MMKTKIYSIEIHDKHNGILSFDLRDLLNIIQEHTNLNWIILDMEINTLGLITKKTSQIIADIDNSSIRISQNELVEFSEDNIQTINCNIRGENDRLFIILKAIDSNYWEVESNDSTLVDLFRMKFKETVCRTV